MQIQYASLLPPPSDERVTEHKSKMAPQGCLPDTFDAPTPVTNIPLLKSYLSNKFNYWINVNCT